MNAYEYMNHRQKQQFLKNSPLTIERELHPFESGVIENRRSRDTLLANCKIKKGCRQPTSPINNSTRRLDHRYFIIKEL